MLRGKYRGVVTRISRLADTVQPVAAPASPIRKRDRVLKWLLSLRRLKVD